MKNLSLQTFFFLSMHLCKQFFSNNTFLQTIFFRSKKIMTSSVNAVKGKSDGIYGIFWVMCDYF